MTMNFEEQEGRQDYLNNKLDDLLEGINASYGQSLLNELVRRLNRTIEDFNEEFQGIIGNLKDNSERRHQILHDLMEERILSQQCPLVVKVQKQVPWIKENQIQILKK